MPSSVVCMTWFCVCLASRGLIGLGDYLRSTYLIYVSLGPNVPTLSSYIDQQSFPPSPPITSLIEYALFSGFV